MRLFLIDNQSTVVPADAIPKICEAMNKVLALFAPAWGFQIPCVEPIDNVNASDPLAFRVVLIDDDPSKPGELGDHDEQGGTPFATILAKVCTDAGGGILDGGSIGISVLSVICHEIFESLCDLNVNDWVFDGRNFLAKEAADPVEGAPGYEIELADGTVALCSNGVLPAYFDAQAIEGSRFDLAGAVSMPFQLLPGGYQIVFDVSTGNVTEVFGERRSPVLEKMRAHRLTRRFKRRVRTSNARLNLAPLRGFQAPGPRASQLLAAGIPATQARIAAAADAGTLCPDTYDRAAAPPQSRTPARPPALARVASVGRRVMIETLGGLPPAPAKKK